MIYILLGLVLALRDDICHDQLMMISTGALRSIP
jgi:hypothetical protein